MTTLEQRWNIHTEAEAAQETVGKSEAALSFWFPPTCEQKCEAITNPMERNHCLKKCIIKDLPRYEVMR